MDRRYMIGVIGDAALEANSFKYELAESLGSSLISTGYRVVTGGLGGIMEAVSKGARSSPVYREGDIIGIIPSSDPDEANSFVDIPIATGLDLARNVIVANCDAIVAIGGGAGTMAEIAMAWMLKRLIIAYRVEGWSGKVADKEIDSRTRYPDIPEDRIYGVDSDDEVLEYLKLLPKYDHRHKNIKRRC